MNITNYLGMMSGLSLFLYGIHMLSESLKYYENKLDSLFQYITRNKFIAVLTGMLVTAVIQSSSALSVMLIGLVNTGILPLENAIWTLMGADIGTTITGQIIALDIGILAPICALIGVICLVFMKCYKIGGLLTGLGILFIGMEIMSSSMIPLAKEQYFLNMLSMLENPIMAILVGTLFTACIQSSSASIGILQILALSYLIEFKIAAYVVFGMNIGTCITSLLASLTGNKNSKRLALFHMMFNILGAIIFTVLCMNSSLLKYVEIYSYNPANAIANLHTLYNIVMVLIVLPFDRYLIKFIYRIIPDKKCIKIVI